MSRTYEALKKAEAERENESSFLMESISVDGHQAPEIDWDMKGANRVEYEKVRVWLTNPAAQGKRIQTVLIVAPRSGTGNTTTASLLAATLAEGKKSRVLIIDGNFRTPALNLVFQVRNNGGFKEVVSEGVPYETHIQPTNRRNLFVMTCGQISNCPSGVFEEESFDQLISHLKQKFDFIVFDGAPALEFPDSYALAPKVDSVLLVIEAEKTSIEEARKIKQNMERAGGRILGVVLNRRKDYMPGLVKRIFNRS